VTALAHKLKRDPSIGEQQGMAISPADLSSALRRVEWRDLMPLRRGEVVREMLLPLPWLGGSLIAAAAESYAIALLCSFVFFLAGLRIVHGGFHQAIGLSRRGTRLVLFTYSLLMLGSMHAVRWNHLRHHRHCLAPEDIEAMGARRSALGAVLLGPLFPVRLHRAALASARPNERRWIKAELFGNALVVAMAIAMFAQPVLLYHGLAMAAGQCLTAFFAVWTVHHDVAGRAPAARTMRNILRSSLTLHMFMHVEHHLFPQVPTPHLPILARRLDAAVPGAEWSLV
jgi:fatty acid desaturase